VKSTANKERKYSNVVNLRRTYENILSQPIGVFISFNPVNELRGVGVTNIIHLYSPFPTQFENGDFALQVFCSVVPSVNVFNACRSVYSLYRVCSH
jgi:hypothetical protein